MAYASTHTPLNANAEVILPIGSPGPADTLVGSVFADQGGTIYIEQSGNGANWDISATYTITANDGKGFAETIYLPYLRVRYVNGGTNQGVFRIFARTSSAGPR